MSRLLSRLLLILCLVSTILPDAASAQTVRRTRAPRVVWGSGARIVHTVQQGTTASFVVRFHATAELKNPVAYAFSRGVVASVQGGPNLAPMNAFTSRELTINLSAPSNLRTARYWVSVQVRDGRSNLRDILRLQSYVALASPASTGTPTVQRQ